MSTNARPVAGSRPCSQPRSTSRCAKGTSAGAWAPGTRWWQPIVLANDLARQGIRVNAVARGRSTPPSHIPCTASRTERNGCATFRCAASQARRDRQRDRVPPRRHTLGRPARPLRWTAATASSRRS